MSYAGSQTPMLKLLIFFRPFLRECFFALSESKKTLEAYTLNR